MKVIRSSWRRIAVIAAVIALVAYLGASWIVYDKLSAVRAMCRGDASQLDNTPAAFDLGPPDEAFDASAYVMPEFEDIRFASREAGIEIAAFWIPADDEDAATVIFVHGHEGCRRDGNNLLVAGMLHRQGFGVLMVDLRDHGESTVEDGRFAGGTDEYLDVLGGFDWLLARGLDPDRIGVVGISLGAATATIAFGEEPRLAALWEDSSYGAISVAIDEELRRNGYPGILRAGGLALAGLFGDDLLAKSPLDAIGRANGRPVFITHGAEDERVLAIWANDLAAAVRASGGTVEPWIVPNMGHTRALIVLTDEYERRLGAFLRGALGAP